MAADTLQLAAGLGGEVDATRAVDLLRQALGLLLDAELQWVGEAQGLGGLALDGVDDQARELLGALAPLAEGRIDREAYAQLCAVLSHQRDLLVGVGGEAVEGDDDRLAEAAEVLDVAV